MPGGERSRRASGGEASGFRSMSFDASGPKLDLSQANVHGRHFDALVLADELERLFERHRPRRDQTHELLRLDERMFVSFFPSRVDVESSARVLAHDHAFVDLDPGTHEGCPAPGG